ncbi:MAG: hypothetical protein HEQ21_14480 [Blastomonas sp.]|uniref:hypothetical protein n=1 Tax=Blastomonas sp. TaxID=1909299 RepID=UPI0025831316|nr:hypothetical protein [Blastomonas sp.]MCO5794025.1 hypothetical protein [Blastomonas sp.]
MTAIVTFKSASAAYLATDSARFNLDGTIHSFGRKVLIWQRQRVVMALQGSTDLQADIAAFLARLGKLANQRMLIEAMPDALRAARTKAAVIAPERQAGGLNDAQLWLAVFCQTERRPRLYTISSCPVPSLPDLVPYQQLEHDGLIAPAVDLAAVIPPHWSGSADQMAADILEAQRHGAAAFVKGIGCMVGGEGELWTVTADGIDREPVIRWPEKVGQRCNPELKGIHLG